MKKLLLLILPVVLVLAASCSGSLDRKNDGQNETGEINVAPLDLSKSADPDTFAEFYSLGGLSFKTMVPKYDLPLSAGDISNYADLSGKLNIKTGEELLFKNGFVVIQSALGTKQDDVVKFYDTLKNNGVPIFVTSDSLLHLYHIQFAETLRQIEEKVFYADLWKLMNGIYNQSVLLANTGQPKMKPAYNLAALYSLTALKLMGVTPDQVCKQANVVAGLVNEGCDNAMFSPEEALKYKISDTNALVDKELDLITKHAGLAPSPLFVYQEDYSQYVPRGHYTRSEKLKNYFRAMMWLGRMTFRLKAVSGLSAQDAKKQTLASLAIVGILHNDQELKEIWKKIDKITRFYVGQADDLGPLEYETAREKAGSDIAAMVNELARLNKSKIYGGQGACTVSDVNDPSQLEKCLDATAGMRLFGQKFVIDSYFFQNLIAEQVGKSTSAASNAFTNVNGIRAFPRGLDVMAILGSTTARELLKQLGDDGYQKYDAALAKLEGETGQMTESAWNKNLYFGWLNSLRALLRDYGAGFPTAMRQKEWSIKSTNGALSSWTGLRHDTILYVKQSYTLITSVGPGGGGGLVPPPVTGYVEPVPELYNRLLSLARMTRLGLENMKVIDDAAKKRLSDFETILNRLITLSVSELENKELSKEDYDFIDGFGKSIESVIEDVDAKAKRTTLVADVHTDMNSQQALEEGSGYVDMIVIAYKVPDGRVIAGAGPILSYYEFKQPVSNRLTDEQWIDMLGSGPPEMPKWFEKYGVK